MNHFVLAYGEELVDCAAWVSDGLACQVAKILPLLSRRRICEAAPWLAAARRFFPQLLIRAVGRLTGNGRSIWVRCFDRGVRAVAAEKLCWPPPVG